MECLKHKNSIWKAHSPFSVRSGKWALSSGSAPYGGGPAGVGVEEEVPPDSPQAAPSQWLSMAGQQDRAHCCPYGTPPPLHLHTTLAVPCHDVLSQVHACVHTRVCACVCVCVCETLASHRVHFCNMLSSKSLLVWVSLTFRKLCRNKPFEAGDYSHESGALPWCFQKPLCTGV